MIEVPLPGLHLDTRRIKKDGTFPVKLRVYYQGKRKYYGLGMNLSQSDFERILTGKRLNENLRDIKFNLDKYILKANKVINDIEIFTFEKFERLYFDPKRNEKDLRNRFELYISQLKQEKRIGTALSYSDALKSLTTFRTGLLITEISVDFLKKYELWMLSCGKSTTTIGFYLRCLRAIMNEAIDKDIISKELYPFGKNKYVIPQARNIKKALKVEEIKKIFEYKPINESESMAKDYWIFSYLCNGINVKDICKLKYKNISKERIIFLRSKTEYTSKNNQKPIIAIINEYVIDILERRGTKNKDPENYVFPILKPGTDPEREKALIRQFTKNINKWIGRIAVKCGIEKKVTTYTARHSFSTVLKRSGASTEMISESLGHSNLRTTENYMDSFEDSVKKELYANLVKF